MNHFIRTCFFLLLSFGGVFSFAQSNIVTYAGNAGKETFYDVLQLTDGSFLVVGYADDLDWTGNAPRTQLALSGNVPNALGTQKFGFILQLSPDLQSILHVVHFPQGAVEDVRFIKTNALPYTPTGDLYISCNTADSDNNNGGYIIAKLNNNFINGIPTATEWTNVVWAKSGPKDYHPWDVTSDGRVYYVSGEAHGYDWSAMYCLNPNGVRMPVEHWRTHWLTTGGEWRGTPASANPSGSIAGVNYSGIVFKLSGRCELRSWTDEEFNTVYPDGNGGGHKGKWPADFLFNSPCDPLSPTANGPGYNGYSSESCCPVWGASSVCIDRRDNHVYLGMNFKSYSNPSSSPDFEPAVIAFGDDGEMLWWSRLYHEITPAGDTVESLPDQYVDALSIDYTHNQLVVGARTHGNNVENLWEGNEIAANPGASGFQNRFTGTQGDIHISWLGKLGLSDGTLYHSTYMAEYSEGTSNLGAPLAAPIMDGWPNPNDGWPNVNTTRMSRNALKTTTAGDVVIMAKGRRTITTANAYQKMVKPYYGGQSAWNSFVRVYDAALQLPKYSSLVVGEWDTTTQQGGDNVELYGVYKTTQGVLCVGRQIATNGVPNGNPLPVINVLPWGAPQPDNESAVLVYYTAQELYNNADSVASLVFEESLYTHALKLYPNPAVDRLNLVVEGTAGGWENSAYNITDATGRQVAAGQLQGRSIDVSGLPGGLYIVTLRHQARAWRAPFVVRGR